MNASFFLHLRRFGAVSILVFAASAAMAQSAPETQSPSAPAAASQKSAPKPADKSQSDSKKANAAPKAPAGFATEAEAKAHCHGGVIWVDKDHFNHPPGTREYGKKPGNFACDQG